MTIPNVANLPEPPEPEQQPESTAKPGPVAASTRLVQLALERFGLGITPDGEPFAHDLTGDLKHIALPLRGGKLGLRQALAAQFFELEGKAAPQTALADALNVLEGKAHKLTPTELHLRVARAEGAIWIDLGDELGRTIELRPLHWRISPTPPPVMFKRTATTDRLPAPSQGTELASMFDLLNVAKHDQPLLMAVMVAALLPDIPHPIPTFTGEQGTGKSTAARMLVELLDPSPVPLRKAPRDPDSYVTGAAGSHVIAYDNLSTIPEWFSDSLCRGVTGDGDVRRTLYTDGDLTVFRFRRQFILTGIDFAGLRGDLAERLVLVELQRIPDELRKDEQTLWSLWRQQLPSLFGGLLTLASQVLELLPKTQLERMPRMADFARVLAAVDRVQGSAGLARYSAQSAEVARDTLTASPFIAKLSELQQLDFIGTSAELLQRLQPDDDAPRPKGWPGNARAVATQLKRNAPAMRNNGWTVEDMGENRQHAKVWHLTSPEMACNGHPHHSQWGNAPPML